VVPKYNRELMHATLFAMKRVQEIREKRQQRFWDRRMESVKEEQKLGAQREIEKNAALLPPVEEKERKKVKTTSGKQQQMEVDE
jgi:large subunit ribosomal protein L24e